MCRVMPSDVFSVGGLERAFYRDLVRCATSTPVAILFFECNGIISFDHSGYILGLVREVPWETTIRLRTLAELGSSGCFH